jgi:hypothetical protein
MGSTVLPTSTELSALFIPSHLLSGTFGEILSIAYVLSRLFSLIDSDKKVSIPLLSCPLQENLLIEMDYKGE